MDHLLLAKILLKLGLGRNERDSHDVIWREAKDYVRLRYQERADYVAAQLVAAGWIPPGGETREEYRITYVNRHGSRVIQAHAAGAEHADELLGLAVATGRWDRVRKETRVITTLPDGREVCGLWDPPLETVG